MGVKPLEHEGGIQWPMVVSLILHALGFGLLLLKLSAGGGPAPEPIPAMENRAADTWAGTTSELPAGEKLYEVSLNELGSGAKEPAAEKAAAAPEAPKEVKPAPKPIEKAAKKPIEKAIEKPIEKAAKTESPPKPKQAKQAPPQKPEGQFENAASSASPAASASAGLGGNDTSGQSFGAVGVPGARDMGRAYNQAIPAACAADPIWTELPLGDVGTIRVVLEIGADGRLVSWKALEENPPKALQNMAKRTYSMLSAGMFTLKPGGLSAGRQTIQVSAQVGTTDKPLPEGGQIELSQHYEGGIGSSSFVQSSGREVKFKVKVLKVEVSEAAL